MATKKLSKSHTSTRKKRSATALARTTKATASARTKKAASPPAKKVAATKARKSRAQDKPPKPKKLTAEQLRKRQELTQQIFDMAYEANQRGEFWRF